MIELNGERLKRYELNRTVTIAPRHGNRLHEVRVRQNEATKPITVPTREENGAIVADIPNIFMERFGTITVEAIFVDEHGSMGEEKRSFTIHENKKPDGYKYEENIKAGTGGGSGGGAGGGSTPIIFKRLYDEESEEYTYSCNKTYAECLADYNSGNINAMVFFGEDPNSPDFDGYYPVTNIRHNGDCLVCWFADIPMPTHSLYGQATIFEDGTVTIYYGTGE